MNQSFDDIDVALRTTAICGECPRWSTVEQLLYWVDIDGKTLNKFDPSNGQNVAINVHERVGSFAFRAGGGFVCASEHGFSLLNAEGSLIQRLCEPERTLDSNRFNDGRCDASGRFWAGSMNLEFSSRTGALFKLDTDHRASRMADDVIVSNGLAFSPDQRVMYWSDSRRSIIFAFDFDVTDGSIDNQQVFVEPSKNLGRPDGAAVDVDGGYWIAGYAGGTVARYTPAGELDRLIRLPVSRVTMCAFGGRELDTLFVTSARIGMTAEALSLEPLAGSIFAITTRTNGMPEPDYLG